MLIELENIGKSYAYQWIFKSLSYSFKQGNTYGISGPNGSGKSTLLGILSGFVSPTKGQAQLFVDGKKIAPDEWYQYISWSGPYIELIEQYSLKEFLKFHQRFKSFRNEMSVDQVIDFIEIPNSKKSIGQFSSGMKQRVKLATAILSDTPIILLDEPGSNLDANAYNWYKGLIRTYLQGCMVVVASNEERDFEGIEHRLHIPDFQH